VWRVWEQSFGKPDRSAAEGGVEIARAFWRREKCAARSDQLCR